MWGKTMQVAWRVEEKNMESVEARGETLGQDALEP